MHCEGDGAIMCPVSRVRVEMRVLRVRVDVDLRSALVTAVLWYEASEMPSRSVEHGKSAVADRPALVPSTMQAGVADSSVQLLLQVEASPADAGGEGKEPREDDVHACADEPPWSSCTWCSR